MTRGARCGIRQFESETLRGGAGLAHENPHARVRPTDGNPGDVHGETDANGGWREGRGQIQGSPDIRLWAALVWARRKATA